MAINHKSLGKSLGSAKLLCDGDDDDGGGGEEGEEAEEGKESG